MLDLRVLLLAGALTLGFGYVEPPFNDIKYADCSNGGSIVRIQKIQATPLPISVIGDTRLVLDFNFTRDLPDLVDVDVLLEHYVLDSKWTYLPCIGGLLGSCTHRLVSPCLVTYGLLGCPITKGRYNFDEYVNLDYVDYFMKDRAQGDYRLIIRANDSLTMEEIACVALGFRMDK